MSRSSESITRVDTRFPNEIYDEIQQLAIKDGARTHHISQKIEVSPTIVKLVKLGLDALKGKLPDSETSVPDILSENIPDREGTLSAIVAEVSDKMLESLEAAISPVKERMEYLDGLSNAAWVELKNDLWLERERMNILIRELTAKSILDSSDTRSTASSMAPDSQTALSDTLSADTSLTSKDNLSDSVPDKCSNLPDKDVMISDKGALLPDNLPDTKNIPSGDSSNSEDVAEEVQITPIDAIEQVSGEVETLSWGDFHKMLGLPTTGNPSKAKGDIAIATAKEQKRGTWVMNSSTRKFTKSTDK
jgi:hypothetical protein